MSNSGGSETDNKEHVSKCESTEVVGSTADSEVTTVQSSTLKDELTNVLETVPKSKEIEAVEFSDVIESTRKDTQVKFVESESVNKKEADHTSNGDAARFCSHTDACDRNVPSKVMTTSDKFPEPSVMPKGHADELPMTEILDKAERSTELQEEGAGGVKAEVRQGPLVRSPGVQIKKTDSNGIQSTACTGVEVLEPPLVFRDTVEEVGVTQVKETLKGGSDRERKECRDTGEGDEDSSSQETYCSDSSFQRTECTTDKTIHIVLEADSECHELSDGTGSLGGASQATTVDAGDLEAIPFSETDMFASQSEETEASEESSGTVPEYSDFVKGSHDVSKTLMQSSTALSMDGLQDSSSTPQTSLTTSERKRKQNESLLPHVPSKLQRIDEDDNEENLHVEQESDSVEISSLGVDVLPCSPVHSSDTDDVAQGKTILPARPPTEVVLREKEVVLGKKANGQQQSVLASPKANRKLVFETETERQKHQFVLCHNGSNGNTEKLKSKTDPCKEGQDDGPSEQGTNDSSPEIKILKCRKPRQSIEVLYVSSHSCDSAKNSSQNGTSLGRKRSSGDAVEVIDIESNAGMQKAADTEAKCFDDELFLHLSPSQSQRSVSDKIDNSHSASLNVDIASHSYKSSNADTLNSESQMDQETLDATKQNNQHVSGSFNSERYSVYVIHESEIEEGPEKASQIQSSRSPTDAGFTAFRKGKDVVQSASVEPSHCVASLDSESQLALSNKRKRIDGKQDTPVLSIAISDSESDGHSTPSSVQKKAKVGTVDLTTERDDTPSSLPQKVSTFQQKGILGLHSTPQLDHMTPAKQLSASIIEAGEQDSVQETDTEWKVILEVKLKYLKQSDKDIFRVLQCEDITEDFARLSARRLCDYSSSGGLADTSSKNTSPSSTASGAGPYPLPPNRLSLISTTSGSSTSSGGSYVVQGVMRQKCVVDGGPFVIPNQPGLKVSRERSFRSEESLFGIQPGICSSIVDGHDIIDKVIISSHPESSERVHGRSTRTEKGESGKKSDIQKPDDGSVLHDIVAMKKTCVGSSSPSDSDAVPVPTNVLKETPKSTVKLLKRRRSRSSVKKRSVSQSKQSVGRKREQLSPIQDKPPVTSLQDVITPNTDSETNGSLDTVTGNIYGPPDVSSSDDHLKLGSSVFARWTDKKYYSGRVQERCKDGRWKVLFDDTSIKPLVEDFVIAADELSKGQLVYALAEGGDYESGVIVNVQKKCNDIMYTVDLDNGSFVTVSRSSLCMTEDQASILREMMTVSLPAKSLYRADISLDNVLEGKRSRISSRDIENKLDSPGVSGMSKASPKRRVPSPIITESDTSSMVEDVGGVEQESLQVKLVKVKGVGRSTPRKNLSKLLGPVPPAGSKIFAGKFFLLTSSDVKLKCPRRQDSEGASDDSQGQYADYETSQNILFSRSHLTEQIKAGSGKLCDRFEDVPPSKYDMCYLISDRPNQTAKFILCLAHGIKLVSHAWIIECCKENFCHPVRKHILAAGWSLQKQSYVMEPNKQPLSHMNIGIISDTEYSHFLKFWKLVLKAAGACVFSISREPAVEELEDLEVVVSGHSCPVNIQKQLQEQGMPLVSTSWIVQCLINGTKVPTDDIAVM